MGGDGGSIPTRVELVRLKKKPEKKERDDELAAKWKHCAISQEPLQQPIVACELGRLYNKDKVIEFLLDRTKFESAANFEHIKGLKDVKELKLIENAEYKRDEAEKGGYVNRGTAEFMCPVTGLEMSGRYRFIMIWGCGCVVAERALKEIKSETCNKCQKPFKPKDVIILNGTDEDIAKLKTNMEERRLQVKLAKKAKKKHKAEAASESTDDPPSKQCKTEHQPSTSKLINGGFKDPNLVDGLNGKSEKSKGIQKDPNESTDDPPSKQSKTEHQPSTSKLINGGFKDPNLVDRLNAGKSKGVQKDPNKSTVFKSLFTTSEKALNQPKGPWVTHDPRFN